MHQQVLTFWFEEIEPKSWWIASPEFDDLVRRRFGDTVRKAALGELFGWRLEPKGWLAEIIVLDQFSRNIFRGTPQAFSQDGMALALAQEAVSLNVHATMSQVERGFLFMPFMHSESRFVHEVAESLYREHGLKDSYDFELKHKAIIDRFGRYPHRNEIIGRASTSDEIDFLSQPGSRF